MCVCLGCMARFSNGAYADEMGEDVELEHSCWDGEDEVIASNEGAEEASCLSCRADAEYQKYAAAFIDRNPQNATAILETTRLLL